MVQASPGYSYIRVAYTGEFNDLSHKLNMHVSKNSCGCGVTGTYQTVNLYL
jgi:hypothetical protein